jgi:hypothetical protein
VHSSLRVDGPGIYPRLGWDDYAAIDAMSQTVLKAGRKSMAHLKSAQTTPIEPTDAMVLGSALHLAFLEPEKIPELLVVYYQRRAGKVWEDFKAEHDGKFILTGTQYEHFKGMTQSLQRHVAFRKLRGFIEDYELTGVKDINGVLCKGRADGITPKAVVDLKKCRDNSPRAFRRQMVDLGYHVQGAFYRHIFDRPRFLWVTVEDSPPYDVVVYELDEYSYEAGWTQVVTLLEHYKRCRELDEWPGRATDIVQMTLPDWTVEADLVGAAQETT